VRALGAASGAKTTGISVGHPPSPAERGVITLGIGMQRRSSMKLADGARRRGTISLKGLAVFGGGFFFFFFFFYLGFFGGIPLF
jgi:hypothetical protein